MQESKVIMSNETRHSLMFIKLVLEKAEKERTPIGGSTWEDLVRVITDAAPKVAEEIEFYKDMR